VSVHADPAWYFLAWRTAASDLDLSEHDGRFCIASRILRGRISPLPRWM